MKVVKNPIFQKKSTFQMLSHGNIIKITKNKKNKQQKEE